MGYGMMGHLGWCFQSSFGTLSVNSMHYVPILSESMKEEIPPIISESLVGRFDVGDAYEGPHSIAGDINMESHPIYLGLLLKGWCGQSSGTLVASHYSHSFKPVTEDVAWNHALPAITLEVDRDQLLDSTTAGSSYVYYDCCVDAINLDIAQGELVKTTASFMGAGFSGRESLTPSYETGSNFTWHQSNVSLFILSPEGLKSVGISLKNNLEAKGYLNGSKFPSQIKRTAQRTAEITLSGVFEADVFHGFWRDQTVFPLSITLTGQEVSSGYNASLAVVFPSARIVSYDIPMGGPGEIEGTMTLQAEYNAGSGCMVEFTLVNTQSIY